jgi:hypothetical protein
MNVSKGETLLVLVDGGGRDGAISDFAKEAGHGVTSRTRSVYNCEVEHGTRSELWLEKL